MNTTEIESRNQEKAAMPHHFAASSPLVPAMTSRVLRSADGRWNAGDAVWITDTTPNADWIPARVVEFLPAAAPLTERVVCIVATGVGMTVSARRILRTMTSEDIAENAPWMLGVA